MNHRPQPISYGRLFLTKWRTLVVLPLFNLLLVVGFWQSQVVQYARDASGVLYMWLVAGLLFLLIQMSLQYQALRQARADTASPNRQEATSILVWQLVIFSVATVYNSAVLVQLTLLGVMPTKPFDLVIGAVVTITVLAAAVRYRRAFASPASRLLISTGTKAAPQWLQAIWFAATTSAGMHIVTLACIVAMGTTRWVMARQAMRSLPNPPSIAAYKAAFRDLASIIALSIGWVIGRLY